MPIVLFQYNACIIAKYDTCMRLINKVHSMQKSYKTEYNMQNMNTHTMRSLLHTILVITHNCSHCVVILIDCMGSQSNAYLVHLVMVGIVGIEYHTCKCRTKIHRSPLIMGSQLGAYHTGSIIF